MSDLPPNASLTDRLKHLIKSYGWYALGLYLVIGVVDFSVAFAGIHLFGAESVAKMAQAVKEYATDAIGWQRPEEPGSQGVEGEMATQSGHEGLYATVILAYTIHKTLFLPVRVGLIAAITPRLVGWLRVRGWAGGAGTVRAAREMRERVARRRDQRWVVRHCIQVPC